MTREPWEAENRRYQAQAPPAVGLDGELGPYDPADYLWSQEPPDDDICRTCYEWRRYPEGQRHFGMAWWRVCERDCQHAHHADEVWIA